MVSTPALSRKMWVRVLWVVQKINNKNERMMNQVLSGTCESGRVKFVKTNVNSDLLSNLKKTLKRVKYKLKVGSGSHKIFKKRFGRLK